MTRTFSIRVLLTLATTHKLVIHQINVKTAFLNVDLEEEIYMTQPRGVWSLVKKIRYASF